MQDELILMLKSQGYSDNELYQLMIDYYNDDSNAQQIAGQLGQMYRDYLPMGGSYEDNAGDIIWKIRNYFDNN